MKIDADLRFTGEPKIGVDLGGVGLQGLAVRFQRLVRLQGLVGPPWGWTVRFQRLAGLKDRWWGCRTGGGAAVGLDGEASEDW